VGQTLSTRWGRHSCLPSRFAGQPGITGPAHVYCSPSFCSRAARARTTGRAGSPLMRFCSPSAVIGTLRRAVRVQPRTDENSSGRSRFDLSVQLTSPARASLRYTSRVKAQRARVGRELVGPCGFSRYSARGSCIASSFVATFRYPPGPQQPFCAALPQVFRLRRRSWGLDPSQFCSCPQAAAMFPSSRLAHLPFPEHPRPTSLRYICQCRALDPAGRSPRLLGLTCGQSAPNRTSFSRLARAGRYCLGFTFARSDLPAAWT